MTQYFYLVQQLPVSLPPGSLPMSGQAPIQPKDKSRTLTTTHSYSLRVDLDSPSAVPGPAASVSPGNWLKVQSVKNHPRPPESDCVF